MNIRVCGYELRPCDRWQFRLCRVMEPDDKRKPDFKSEDGTPLLDLSKYPSTVAAGLSTIRHLAEREVSRGEILELDAAIKRLEAIDDEFRALSERIASDAEANGLAR